MQITTDAPKKNSLDTRSWLALAFLTLLGIALTGVAAVRFGLVALSTATASDGALTVSADEMAFGTETIRFRAGESVALQLRNEEFLPHSFDVDALDIHLAMPPRGTERVELGGLPAGTYTFYCAVPGHREAGMTGTLIVE